MTTFEPTKRGLKDLLGSIKRSNYGLSYYAVAENEDGEYLYREIRFKHSRLWGPVWHHMSAEAVLSNYGPLYGSPPAGTKPLFGSVAQYPPFDEDGNRIKYDEKHGTSEKATAAAR